MKKLTAVGISLTFILTVTPVHAGPFRQYPDGEAYWVLADDWLSKIAQKYYGDAMAYPIIVAATNAKASGDHSFARIADPNRIEIGQKLWIPGLGASLTPFLHNTLTLSKEIQIGSGALAFSRDDRLLAIGGNDGGIQIWDTGIWSLLWEASHGSRIRELTLSADGQRLATVSDDNNAARLWDAAHGNLIAEISHPDWRYFVSSVAFSSDSQLLAAGGSRKVLVVSAATGQPLYDLTHDYLITNDLAFSPNGTWLAALVQYQKGPSELVVWDLLTREKRSLANFLISMGNVVFSPDSAWLAADVSASGTVWETGAWPEPRQLVSPSDKVTDFAFAADGQRLAGRVGGEVWMWQVPTWRVLTRIELGGGILQDIALSSDGQWLIAGIGHDHSPSPFFSYEARLWHTTTGKMEARLLHPSPIWTVALSHDGRWTAIGGAHLVKIWEKHAA
jgi:WD40 repeat protein